MATLAVAPCQQLPRCASSSRPASKIILTRRALGLAGLDDRKMALSGVADMAASLCAVVQVPLPCATLHPRHNGDHDIDCALPWSHYFNLTRIDGTPIIYSAAEMPRQGHLSKSLAISSVRNNSVCSNAHRNAIPVEIAISAVVVESYSKALAAAEGGRHFTWTIDVCWYMWFAGLQHHFYQSAERAYAQAYEGSTRHYVREPTPLLWEEHQSTFGGFKLAHHRHTVGHALGRNASSHPSSVDEQAAASAGAGPPAVHPEPTTCTRVHAAVSASVRRAADAVLRATGAATSTAWSGDVGAADAAHGDGRRSVQHGAPFGLMHIRRGDMANYCPGIMRRGEMRPRDILGALSCVGVPARSAWANASSASTPSAASFTPLSAGHAQHEARARDVFVEWMRAQPSPLILVFSDEKEVGFLAELIGGVGTITGWRARVVHADAVATRVLSAQIHRAGSACTNCRDFALLSSVMSFLKGAAAVSVRFGFRGVCPSPLAAGCEQSKEKSGPHVT